MSTYLETTDGSCKFYRVEVKGSKTVVTYVRRERERAKEMGDKGEKGGEENTLQ